LRKKHKENACDVKKTRRRLRKSDFDEKKKNAVAEKRQKKVSVLAEKKMKDWLKNVKKKKLVYNRKGKNLGS
jgi:hypothetical protein